MPLTANFTNHSEGLFTIHSKTEAHLEIIGNYAHKPEIGQYVHNENWTTLVRQQPGNAMRWKTNKAKLKTKFVIYLVNINDINTDLYNNYFIFMFMVLFTIWTFKDNSEKYRMNPCYILFSCRLFNFILLRILQLI